MIAKSSLGKILCVLFAWNVWKPFQLMGSSFLHKMFPDHSMYFIIYGINSINFLKNITFVVIA
jgi:hypothetical protein